MCHIWILIMAAKAVKKASMQVCYHIPVCHTACIHYADFKNIIGASVSEPHTGELNCDFSCMLLSSLSRLSNIIASSSPLHQLCQE